VSCGIIKHITSWDDITGCQVAEPSTVRFNSYGIRYGTINGKQVQGYVMGNPKAIISLIKANTAILYLQLKIQKKFVT